MGLTVVGGGAGGIVCLFYRERIPGEAKKLLKKLQVGLDPEPKCPHFPGQFSCHYPAFFNSCQLLLSPSCMHLECWVGARGTGALDPLSRVINSSSGHTHTGFKALVSLADWEAHLYPGKFLGNQAAAFLSVAPPA